MNIFDMYKENGNSCGFFVQRHSWGKMIAKVISIGDVKSGSISKYGRAPYYNAAKELVVCEMYSLKMERIVPTYRICRDDPMKFYLSCPGTYSYSMVQFESV